MMGIYKISSLKTTDVQGKGTMENPFILTPSYSDGCDEVEIVNLNESVVRMGEGTPLSLNSIQRIYNGTNVATNGNQAFYSARKLQEYICDMPNMTTADYMFSGCTKLNTFVSEMPMLQRGKTTDMFRGCPLTSVTIVLNSTWADSVPSDLDISVSEGFDDEWDNATPLPNGNIKFEYRRRLLD